MPFTIKANFKMTVIMLAQISSISIATPIAAKTKKIYEHPVNQICWLIKINEIGPNVLLCKINIERVFRNLRIDHFDYPMLGLKWQNNIYIDFEYLLDSLWVRPLSNLVQI